jgi:hypothetical protein
MICISVETAAQRGAELSGSIAVGKAVLTSVRWLKISEMVDGGKSWGGEGILVEKRGLDAVEVLEILEFMYAIKGEAGRKIVYEEDCFDMVCIL